jgi:crossover junction endodeoxyribonuclease RuvC
MSLLAKIAMQSAESTHCARLAQTPLGAGKDQTLGKALSCWGMGKKLAPEAVPQRERVIMGIDPGSQIMGFAVLKVKGQKAVLQTYGVERFGHLDNHLLKIQAVFEQTKVLIEKYLPDELAIEAPFYGKNIQAMLKLGRAQGACIAAALAHNVSVVEYAPKRVKQAVTGKDGYYYFIVQPSSGIKVSGAKTGYFTRRRTIPTVLAGDKLLHQDLILPRIRLNKALSLRNIYYDFDKWDLRPESVEVLEQLFEIMTENPTILIECSSHTDMRGTNSYNDNLSIRRALVVMDYLVAKGIPSERLTYKVYGEVMPANPCPTERDCSEDGHQLNRRTEFRILYF